MVFFCGFPLISTLFRFVWKYLKKNNTSRSPVHWCRLPSQFVDDANWHLTLIPHLLGSHGSNWSSSMQMSPILHFQAIIQIDLTVSHDIWPSSETFDLMNMWRFLYCINKKKIWFQSDISFQTRWILHFEHILQLDLWWPLVYDLWPHEHTKGPILYQ